MSNFKNDLEKIIEATGITNISKFPFNETESFRLISIDVLELNARASNGLYRQNIKTLGNLIDNWERIPSLRGLGATSVKEIKRNFYEYYYSTLSAKEVKRFWNRFVEMNYDAI